MVGAQDLGHYGGSRSGSRSQNERLVRLFEVDDERCRILRQHFKVCPCAVCRVKISNRYHSAGYRLIRTWILPRNFSRELKREKFWYLKAVV
jgi:hypothetical protein